MPLYEYECDKCGRRFELIRKFSDPPVEVCPHCERGPLRRLQSAPAIQFKGSGFYITDYARQGGDGGKSDKAAETAKDSKPDATSSQSGSTSENKSSESSAKPAAPAKPAGSSAASTSGAKD